MNVTKQQIQEWKKQYGDVYVLNIEGKKAYLRTPDRQTLSYASTLATKDPLKFNEVVLNEEIKTDDTLFLAASSKLPDLIQIKEATLEKL